MSTLRLRLCVDISTSWQHIWISRSLACNICIVLSDAHTPVLLCGHSVTVKTMVFSSDFYSRGISCRMCHTSVLYGNGCTDKVDFFAYRCALTYAVVSQNKGTSIWNFLPNSRLQTFHHGTQTFHHGTPTVGKCDINSDSRWSGVDSTWQWCGRCR